MIHNVLSKILITLSAAFILVGCGGGSVEPWPPSYGIEERAIHSHESAFFRANWRDSIKIPAGYGTRTVSLGPIGDNRAVRAGVLLSGDKSIMGGLTVYLDGEEVAKSDMLRPILWTDMLLEFNPLVDYDPEAECTVAFDVNEEFWVAPLELVNPEVEQPNVLVFLVDTLRADHCSLYGYERITTPHLDELARGATTFDNMYSVSSWTRPSVASLFSGVYPATHGAKGYTDVMRDDVPRLARVLKENGYATYAYARNANVHPYWNMGTEFFNYGFYGIGQGDANVMRALYRTVKHLRGQKWFLYVHLLDPHGAYRPQTPLFGPYKGMNRSEYQDDIFKRLLGGGELHRRFGEAGFGIMEAQYDAAMETISPEDHSTEPIGDIVRASVDFYDTEITQSDDYLREVLEILKDTGQLDNTIIVFLSDHGEEFFEHEYWWHGNTLYNEVVRVPLVIRQPHDRGDVRRSDAYVQSVDIAPTILELLDIPIPASMEGLSLKPILDGGELEDRIPYMGLNHQAGKVVSQSAAIEGSMKLIVDHIENTEQWFDLDADPGEQSPLAEAPSNAEPIYTRIDEMRVRTAAGLHLIFTSLPTEEQKEDVYEGTVTVPNSGEVKVHFPKERYTIERDGDSIKFRIVMGDEDLVQKIHHPTIAQMYIETDMDSTVTVEFTKNGESVANIIKLTQDDFEPVATDNDPIPVQDLIAGATRSDPSLITPDGRVYSWFIPATDSMGIDEMDETMRETLEGLGYL